MSTKCKEVQAVEDRLIMGGNAHRLLHAMPTKTLLNLAVIYNDLADMIDDPNNNPYDISSALRDIAELAAQEAGWRKK